MTENASGVNKNSIDNACPLCGIDDYYLRYPSTRPGVDGDVGADVDRYRCTSHDLGSHGDIVCCNGCGMVYNVPRRSPEELAALYRGVEDPLYREESGARERTFRRSLAQLHCFARPPGKLLDIGCYTGVFMKEALSAGWDVEGLELSGWAAGIAAESTGAVVHRQTLDRLDLPESSFDVVTLWDVVEHLTDPVVMLERVHRILKPGGVMAFSTHMVDSLAARLLGTRYPFFMEMHVVHFSRSTVGRMLSGGGFDLLRIKSHHRVLRMGYFLEKLYHKIKLPPFHGLLKWLSCRSFPGDLFIRIGGLGLVNIFACKRKD